MRSWKLVYDRVARISTDQKMGAHDFFRLALPSFLVAIFITVYEPTPICFIWKLHLNLKTVILRAEGRRNLVSLPISTSYTHHTPPHTGPTVLAAKLLLVNLRIIPTRSFYVCILDLRQLWEKCLYGHRSQVKFSKESGRCGLIFTNGFTILSLA